MAIPKSATATTPAAKTTQNATRTMNVDKVKELEKKLGSTAIGK